MTVAQKLLVVASLIVGSMIVGSITFGLSAQSGEQIQDNLPPVTPLLPATTGFEVAVFDDAIAASDSGGASVTFKDVTVTIHERNNDDVVCFTAVITHPNDEGVIDGCFERDVVRTGLAYSAGQSHDGPIIVFGIVPDEVTSVTVGRTAVEVRDNVWQHTAPAGTLVEYSVANIDGTKAVSSAG